MTFAELDFRQRPAAELAGEADVVLFPLPALGELLAADALQTLPKELLQPANLDWTDLFLGLRERVAASDRGSMLLPINAPVLVCYYRDDLLRQAGLSPPATWDDYQRLLDQWETWAPGLTAVEPWSPEFRATLFLARAVSFARHPGHFSLYFDIEEGRPLIDGPGFVRGLETALRAFPRLAPESASFDPADCRREILSGRAALAITYETGPGNAPLPFAPVKAEMAARTAVERAKGMQIGFCRLPGASEAYNPTLERWEAPQDAKVNVVGLTGFGGLALGISTRTASSGIPAASNLLESLVDEENFAAFPAGSRALCRESQLLDPGNWTGPELSPSEMGRYLDAVSRSLRDRHLVLDLPFAARDEFRTALAGGVTEGLKGEKDPQAVLTGVATAWHQILARRGAAAIIDSYRRSLGIPPKSAEPSR